MSERIKRKEELQKFIEGIDSGVILVTIYKGMPVKIRLVSKDEIIIGGETATELDNIEFFSPRKWWDE